MQIINHECFHFSFHFLPFLCCVCSMSPFFHFPSLYVILLPLPVLFLTLLYLVWWRINRRTDNMLHNMYFQALTDIKRDTFQCVHLHLLITAKSYTASHMPTWTNTLTATVCISAVILSAVKDILSVLLIFTPRHFKSSCLLKKIDL